MHATLPLLAATDFPALTRRSLDTLQVNLGYKCNQSCLHCHVAASPQRTEMMQADTIGEVLEVLKARRVATLDLTGGAPELNAHFRHLVREARALGVRVIDRCNLTILSEPGQEDLAEFLAEQGVEVTASLPCYSPGNVDRQRGDGVFDREVSMFDNDFSNMTGLFEVAGGGSFRVNEFRRVGFPSFIRESRFRWFGTEATFEEMTTTAYRQDREGVTDVSEEIEPRKASEEELAKLADVSPTLRDAFLSGLAPVHDPSRLPAEFAGAPNGHEGSHHFLVDDFVTAVAHGTLPPVNAWEAARYTLPGIVAHQSALQGGVRLPVPDFGDAPQK